MSQKFYQITGQSRIKYIKQELVRLQITLSSLEKSKSVFNKIISIIDNPNDLELVESMTVHGIVTFISCFNSKFNYSLHPNVFNDHNPKPDDGKSLSEREFFQLVKNYRDKHIAHSDDLLKDYDVGGCEFNGEYGVVPLVALRIPVESKEFYINVCKLIDKTINFTNSKIKEKSDLILNGLKDGSYKLTSDEMVLEPISSSRTAREIWGIKDKK